ncbi:hypothetical protein M422DRAFT_172807 [Sphaerobolus stellatus SS14]|uniref:Thioesterase domain-containing protein n=1 Tax=Sphaerobolus stellatus (strain SS14) TaxID=990650 RepID=A0A0C9VI18_SPHS4|nr:hypothetical protein M422DRAFT_172807 [Sphaerobolus stellatus SS14]
MSADRRASNAAETIKGNVSDDVKAFVAGVLTLFMDRGEQGFGDNIGLRMKIVEVSVNPMPGAPKRKEGLVICELEVEQDMVNGGGNMHGGCSAYLIDICTSLPLAALTETYAGVSQSINMIYHAPAPLGTKLRIISKSLTLGTRALTSRGEIWDIANQRLVASGTHVKMAPSVPASKL